MEPSTGKCSVCDSLPNEITVNYGRDERYPEAYNKLVKVEEGPDTFKRCPACRTYFFCVDSPQEYGSGNNAEETIQRFSREQSRCLDKLFGAEPSYSLRIDEASHCVEIISLHQLLPALSSFTSRHPDAFGYFVPALVEQLRGHNDKQLFDVLLQYVNQDRQRAEYVIASVKAGREPKPLLMKLIQRCFELT